jgi:hypothetical protein
MLINPGKLHNLINAVDKSIYVDEDFSIKQLAEQMANLSANNILGKTIPVEDEQMVDGVGDALIVDPAKVKKFVHELINGPSPSSSSSSSAPTSPATSTSTPKTPIDAGCIH